MKIKIIALILMILIAPAFASSLPAGQHPVEVQYSIPTSGPGGGAGGGGGGGASSGPGFNPNDGICNPSAGESSLNAPNDCGSSENKSEFYVEPLRLSGFVAPGERSEDLRLLNPNSNNITIFATVICNNDSKLFCNYIGFDGEFPNNKPQWSVPAGNSQFNGKKIIKVKIVIPQGVEKRDYTAEIRFSGDGLITKVVPVEYVYDEKIGFLNSILFEFRAGTLQSGEPRVIKVTGLHTLLVTGIGGISGFVLWTERKRKIKELLRLK